MKKGTGRGYLYAVISAVMYGCMPLMAKHIYADGVNPISLVFLRNVFSLLPLALLAYIQNGTLKIQVKHLPSISLFSILGCCLTPILLFSSYRYIESGTATVFHFVYPALVVILEMIFMGKKTRLGNLVSVLLCIVGIFLFYSPQQTLNLTGSSLALASGLTFALYVVLLAHFKNPTISGFLLAFYIALISSIATLVICLVTDSFVLPATFTGWMLCILFSLLITTCAVTLFQRSAFLIGSERTSILSTLEPITSIVIGIAVFHEPLTIRVAIGSALVVAASLLIACMDLRKEINKKA